MATIQHSPIDEIVGSGPEEHFEEEGLIIGCIGRKRQGKDLSLAAICWEAYQEGWKVAHNGSLRFGEELDVDQLINLGYQDYFINLSEAHNFFDSRRGQRLLNVMGSAYLTQVGKLNNFLLWSTHRLNLIDLRLRDATDLLITVHKDRHVGAKTLYWQIEDINGAYNEPGTRRNATMHNMHEYFEVFDTKTIFPFLEGTKSARDLQNDKKYKEMNAVLAAVQGFLDAKLDRANPMQIAKVIERDLQMKLPPEVVGKHLTNMGVARKKSGGIMYYDLNTLELV